MIAEVLLPLPIDKQFYYAVRDDVELAIGDYVSVPFGTRSMVGVVMGFTSNINCALELKYINERVQLPSVQLQFINFMRWVSFYNIIPMGMVLKMMLGNVVNRKTLHLLYSDVRSDITAVPTAIGCNSVVLSQEQTHAYNAIVRVLHMYSVTVLDGETGSGKTEVYCSALAKLLREDSSAQVLVLLPEIVLATQLMKRVHSYFAQHNPIEWHSGLAVKKRRENWLAVLHGTTSIVVGARSALFLPFKNLKMIVVDEEHESSFKQDSGIIYNARDMSVVLAKQVNIPIVLCSATPSLETMHNVHKGRYHHIVLKKRFGEAQLPDIAIVDMRKSPLLKEWLSVDLYNRAVAALRRGSQVMLFLNLRGYARLVLCKKCGHKVSCPNCCAWLVEHRGRKALLCHYCAYSSQIPTKCSECLEECTMISYGVGIERVAEGIKELLPDARIAVMSSDMTTKSMQHVLEKVLAGEIDIIIGTQVIAKGHNFPGLALVGIIDADLGLGNSDLRASERTYQLLHQASGRSGRFKEKGEVILQTHDAENPIMKSLLSYQRESFYQAELQSRMMTDMPPYTRLVAFVISGRDELQVADSARDVGVYLSKYLTVLGPAPAPMSVVNKQYRYRILLKIGDEMETRKLLLRCRDLYKKPKVKVVIDVDPMSFA